MGGWFWDLLCTDDLLQLLITQRACLSLLFLLHLINTCCHIVQQSGHQSGLDTVSHTRAPLGPIKAAMERKCLLGWSMMGVYTLWHVCASPQTLPSALCPCHQCKEATGPPFACTAISAADVSSSVWPSIISRI